MCLEGVLLVEREPVGRSAGVEQEADGVRSLLFGDEEKRTRVESALLNEAIDIVAEDGHEIRAATEAACRAGIGRS